MVARAFEKERKSGLDAKDRKIRDLERKLADRDEGIADFGRMWKVVPK